jgi:corrinoid protein of di/trimethylamine methyltransferase
MTELQTWRGFDLAARRAKIAHALKLGEVRVAEDVPLIINTPCYFAFAGRHVPDDYFTNPASMVAYQADGWQQHLEHVHDDAVPYFMPWFGTGVLASAFGCAITLQPGPGNDPAVAGPCVHAVKDIAHLRLPEPGRAGWMPRVLDAIDYAYAHSDLPLGLTDMQGPLDTAGLICGQAQLYQWMYREPAAVHDLMDLVTTAFIEWVKVQKQRTGESLDSSNGLQGICSPGLGVWESDDDMVLLDSGLYREFVRPYVSRILEAFGGGHVHFCGDGRHQIDNLLQMPGLRAVNNSPMGNFAAFGELRRRLSGRAAIEIQDGAPVDLEGYYHGLFDAVDDFRGLILAPFVLDTLGMDHGGGYQAVDWDPLETANRMVQVARDAIRRRLAGERLSPEPALASHAGPSRPAGPAEPASAPRPDLSAPQEAALTEVRLCLLDFDSEGVQAAIREAVAAGVAPFDVVVLGLAEAMAEVGRLYEGGEYFLPELVMAGATMNDGMVVLQPLLLQGAAGATRGVVVLGTVQGDMHDIGKNIVKTLLSAAGFTVHDIGIDQSVARFVEAARDYRADIVALSALLTTTMSNMPRVVQALQEAGLGGRVKVMVGGAPISREFADQIGAEGYAPDAVKAIREAERLLRG